MDIQRLLIVDNDPAICELLTDIGKNSNFDVLTTTHAKEFQKKYFEYNPNFIILDLAMQEIDSIELLRFLNSNLYKHPLIIIGNYDDKTLNTAKHLGQTYHLNIIAALKKPLKVSTIADLLIKAQSYDTAVTKNMLSRAIEEYNFVLHYQPQLNVETRKITGVETLVRWQVPNKGILYPEAFISIAEETNLIKPLTDWTIQKAFEQIARWKENKLQLNLSINLSSKVLTNLKLPDEIAALAYEYKIDPHTVTFEIAESTLLTQSNIGMDVLTRLRLIGFKLSIDNFGTSSCSLTQLYRMPFTEIKIDKSFTMNLNSNPESLAIATAITQIGHSLGLSVVAEGVETQDAWSELTQLNCDTIQGYFISLPLTAERVEEWLKTHTNSELELLEK